LNGLVGTFHAYMTVERFRLETHVARPCNQNIVKVLRLSRNMMLLADKGDETRQDISCGVLYGTLRDTAYKLRHLAEQEVQVHKNAGIWDTKEQNVG
jgi:hypothetical protein